MHHLLGCALVGIVISAASPVLAENRTPNVVFILADNVGYEDLGPYEASRCFISADPPPKRRRRAIGVPSLAQVHADAKIATRT
jgi:hypothetical protein